MVERVNGFALELDSIEIDDFSANDCGSCDEALFVWRTKHEFDLAAQWDVCGGEHVHAVLAQVQGRTVDTGFAQADLNGHGDPLPGRPSLIPDRCEEHHVESIGLYRGRVDDQGAGQVGQVEKATEEPKIG